MAAASKFPTLFSPITINKVTLRNRIVSPPHGTYFAEGLKVSDRQLAYYEERARGGVGYIIAGNWQVWPRAISSPSENLAVAPGALDGHKRLADVVHRHGTILSAQVHFSGRHATSAVYRRELLGPSPLSDPTRREVPKEMEPFEIEELIEHYGFAAAALKEAGWDGCDVMAAQGYGLSQFLSPGVNHRTDEWGGSIENRARIVVRILDAIRSAAGRDFLVGVRINASDFVEGGFELDEAIQTIGLLEATGNVDYLNISGAGPENWPLWIADMGHQSKLFVPYATKIRERTALPIMVVTRIRTPAEAESVLVHEGADLVGMNRVLIADPEMPNKAKAGRAEDIRRCIYGNQGCVDRAAFGSAMSCTVNPSVGRERDFGVTAIKPAAAAKKLAVVGGGPAGLQAAALAAQRGHSVVLYEQTDELGGQILLAAKPTSRREMMGAIDNLKREVEKHKVDVRLGRRVSAQEILNSGPDHIVIATGSTPMRTGFSGFRPSVREIPGCALPHVLTSWEAMSSPDKVGARVLVLEDDPHTQAISAAEFLAENGKSVTIVTRSEIAGISGGRSMHNFIYRRLYKAEIDILPHTWIDEITSTGVAAYNIWSKKKVELEGFDTVILCTGNLPHTEFYDDLRKAKPDFPATRIGDCLTPRKLDEAIWEAFNLAFAI